MLSLSGIVETITSPFKPMYGVKPSLDANDALQPYKLYKFNMFGIPQPKNAGFSHKYTVEQAAHTLLECLNKGHKVYVLQETVVPAEEPDQAPQNQEEIDRHTAWKRNLLNTLQSRVSQDISLEITKDPIRLYGTRSSTTKKESYNEIVKYKRNM